MIFELKNEKKFLISYTPPYEFTQSFKFVWGVHEIFFEKKNYLDFIPVIKMYAQIVKKNPIYFDVAPTAWS